MKKYLYLAFVLAVSYVHGSAQDQLRQNLKVWSNTPGGESVVIHGLMVIAAADKKKSEQEFKLRQAINSIVSKEESTIRQFRIYWRDLLSATGDKADAKRTVLTEYCEQNQPNRVSLPEVLGAPNTRELNSSIIDLLRKNHKLRMAICTNTFEYSISQMTLEQCQVYEGAKPFPQMKY